MKRTPIRKRGKKANEWARAKRILIKEAIANGRIEINENGNLQGFCEDCKKWKDLSPDHIKKRSLGGSHEKTNIAWVCFICHQKRDNQPMSKKKNNKPVWQEAHKCISCKKITRFLMCNFCGKLSISAKT